jgi:phosphohistidine phosphatase SixA
MKAKFITLIFFGLLLGCKSDTENGVPLIPEAVKPFYFISADSKLLEFRLPGIIKYQALYLANQPIIEGNTVKFTNTGVYSVLAYQDDKKTVLVKFFVTYDIPKISTLNDGGTYALVFRHSDANVGADNFSSTIFEWWKSCDAKIARQINDAGLQKAKSIGENLKILNIPIGSLYSSEFCRCRQTLEKMNFGSFENSKELTYQVYKTNYKTEVTTLLKKLPINKKVHILIGHSELSTIVTPFLTTFNWNDALLYRLETGKEPIFVSVVRNNEWIDIGL